MNSVPSGMWEWLSTLEPHGRLALSVTTVVLSLVASVLVALIVAVTVRGIHQRRLEDALKRELLDRGLSAEEIDMIVRATPTKGGPAR
jgi:hypothetical protein